MDILTLDEVCTTMLKITVQTGRNRLSRGLPMPPSFRIGRRRLFVASEVDRWISEQAGVQISQEGDAPRQSTPRRGRPRLRASTTLV